MTAPARSWILASSLALALLPLALPAEQDPVQGRRERLGVPASDAMLCGKCHEAICAPAGEDGFVHPPVAEGRCVNCHNPHASTHGALLTKGQSDLCFSCHEAVEEQTASPFVHTPVQQGECVKCHEAHRGSLEHGLRSEGVDLCSECHASEVEKLDDPDLYLHAPFEMGGCLLCHDAHAGAAAGIVRASAPQLCAPCHDLEDADLAETHLGIDMTALDCLSCHTPHATTQENAIRSFQHEPFADRGCDSCHDVDGDDPVQLLGPPPGLCNACHADPLEVAGRQSVHKPVMEGQCLACHAPHASDTMGLMRGKESDVCMSCHTEVRERAASEKSSHLDYDSATCSACHTPHASAEQKLLKGGPNQVCGECHNQHATFSHPMGAKALDPLSGKPIDCVTCHDPHGTAFPFFLRDDPNRDLCVQCHEAH